MQRRKLLATAGALSLAAFTTTVALGANLGLFVSTVPDSPAGRLDAQHTTPSADDRSPPRVVPVAAAAQSADD